MDHSSHHGGGAGMSTSPTAYQMLAHTDLNGTSTDTMHGMMKMFFHFGLGDLFLVEGFVLDSSTKLWLISLALFVGAILLEAIDYSREYLSCMCNLAAANQTARVSSFHLLQDQDNGQHPAGCCAPAVGQVTPSGSCCGQARPGHHHQRDELAHNTAGANSVAGDKPAGCCPKKARCLRREQLYLRVSQAILQSVRTGLSLALMLAAMTYNICLIFAILLDTREVRPPHGSSYLLYNVHIDGLYHCSLRFKQLLHLHQALSRKFQRAGDNNCYHQLPPFPPKKLLPLSANQVENRRTQLEKYLQNISQDKEISNSSIFNLFLLEAQRESTGIREDQVHLDIELVNGQKIRLQIVTHDSADAVLTLVCRALGLNDRYHAYFCLCLCGYDVVRDKLIIKRRLSFFEAPFVTLQMAIQQQEQLQSVLSSASNNNNSTNYKTSNTSINNNTNSCHCLSCSAQQQHQQQQQQQSQSNTTGIPIVGSSTSTTTATSSGFYVNSNNPNLQSSHFNQPNCATNGSTYYNHLQSSSSSNGRPFVTHRILLRKSYWDPIYDTYLLNDQQALNLLFIQTVYDIKHSLMFVDKDTYHQLESLLASDSKLEYILLARSLKYYNYVHFEPCYSDYPRPRTKVMISIGSKELNMRVLKSPASIATTHRRGSAGTSTNNITTTRQANSSSTSSSSSPSGSSSSSSAVSSSSSVVSTSAEQQQAANNNNSNSSEPTLYCTSSLIPSGYQHLITKEDIVEEEYNFKVPLIRCWRLTSLETLGCNQSAGAANGAQQQRRQSVASSPTTTAIAGGKRRSLSLFNSVVGNSPPSSGGSASSSYSSGRQQQAAEMNDSQRRQQMVSSGADGASLMAALTAGGHQGSSGHHLSFRCNGSADTNNNNNHQFCQHENQRCEQPRGGGGLDGATDHGQFSQYELSFEYLVSKDTLRWITISSDQAIFISISLQGVVDELVSKRDGSCSLYDKTSSPDRHPGEAAAPNRLTGGQRAPESFTYMYRDGQQKMLNTSNQQLIDKFGTTLGYSPMNPYALAMARQRQQVRAAGLGQATSLLGGPPVLGTPSSSSSSSQARFASSINLSQGLVWAMETTPTSHLQTSTTRISTSSSSNNSSFGSSQPNTAFEITSFKKAPSPIFNDAFEGVANADDL